LLLIRVGKGEGRVIVNCPGLEHGGAMELHAIEEGVVGRRWISPCPLEGAPYNAILVDRGFVPEGSTPPPPAGKREVRPVVGFLRDAEPPGRFAPPSSRDQAGGGVWYARDLPAMARVAGLTNVAPVFLMLESPPPAGGLPRPSPLPTRISNNHLGYAITWFGLAAALLGVYVAMMFRPRDRA
jgi:surfeit locus 1 family protein